VALVTQPVNPQPLNLPYPPNQVLLPFQPPVSYSQGQFASGKTLLELLQSGVPEVAMGAATITGNVAQNAPDDVTITVYSKTYVPIGEINDYISLTFQLARNKVGGGEIVLKGTDENVVTLLNCPNTTVPITIETGTIRWSGRVIACEDRLSMIHGTDRPVNTVVVTLASDYMWLSKILCWPNFLMPLQAQFPDEALYLGPAVTCIATLIQEQAFRLQSGIWELSNNLGSLDLDWTSWFGTLLESDGDLQTMLMTPIVVVPVDPILDTSPWVSFSGRMDQLDTLIEQVCKDTGTNVAVGLWLPTDPQPTGLSATLTVPTILVQVTNNLSVTGPSGTFLDGILQDTVDLSASDVGDMLAPFLNPTNEFAPQGINIAPVLGINFVQPWVLFTDDPRSGLINYSIKGRHPLAFTVVGGGKSPQWIDDLLNITSSWAIDALTTLIGISGIPDDLFDGIIDDVILAFQQIENGQRRLDLGPYGFPEFFVQTGSSAYTLDEWFALEGAMWDTRGLYTYQWTWLNGFPYTLGVDIFVGQLASFANRGQLYTDWIDSVVYTDDRTTRLGRLEVTVGDGQFVENPVAKIYRKLVNAEKAFQIISLSYN
jgi:Siphovirus ReqiPepy6 Gp37-like protein